MFAKILRLQQGRVFQQLRSTRFSGLQQQFHAARTLSANATSPPLADENEEATTGQKSHKNPFTRESPPSTFAGGDGNSRVEERMPLPPLAREPAQLADREKLLKVLQLEADIAYQEGRRVPPLEFFTDEHWAHALTLSTRSARTKYYSYLWQLEKKKLAHERKKMQKAESVQERIAAKKKEREENEHIMYGLSDVSMFLRIYDSAINHWQNNRLTRAMQFAPKIVLDCSYDEHMNKREALNAAKQLMLCFADNRAHDDPFDLHYCNVNLQSICAQALHRYIPTMLNPEFPMNIHSECFTELFPRENLVYLTPHCRTDLLEYNADDVYIVGAMVDKMNNEPLSLAKAKRLKLRMARLPLDQHLQWGAGSGKSLTLNQMIKILLDLKRTGGDWQVALQHVPRRKIVDVEEESFRFRRNMQKHAQRLNVRIDKLWESERDDSRAALATHKPIRSRKKDLEFNLNSWAAADKKKQQGA